MEQPKTDESPLAQRPTLSDVLERARRHLRQMAPHVRERESAQILADMVKELQWERGRPTGKITLHWMRAAFDRIAIGEPEEEVMRDFGYERSNAPHEVPGGFSPGPLDAVVGPMEGGK